MNSLLAEMYGTAETVGEAHASDQEKLAQAKLLEFFQSENIDVDKLSDDTVVKVAQQLFGETKEAGEMPPELKETVKDMKDVVKDEKEEEKEEEEEEKEESSEEKVAEADFLGRVMAHAFHQEKTAIEKKAAQEEVPAGQEKSASNEVLDQLAQNRALEMLKEAGYELPTEEQANEEQKLAAAIDQRAFEMLKEAGYPVE